MENTKKSLWELDDPVEICCRNIGMVYRTGGGEDVNALTGINIDVKKGEFVSLLGPSGCGKTTLLRIIADLVIPSEGSIYIDGGLPQNARLKKKFGMVFQSAVLYEWRTVWMNVRLPLEILKIPANETVTRIENALELVGLSDFRNYYPHQLSGGMQQRAAIARAFVIDPDILLMDEPFSALDEFTREKLHEDLLRIWRRTNKTVVFVTHNIAESVYLSDKVFVMSPRPGRISGEITIDLPRPRSPKMRNTVHFNELIVKIRNSFEGI
jgi:NitT/TauT family transport system ATP-binding protein